MIRTMQTITTNNPNEHVLNTFEPQKLELNCDQLVLTKTLTPFIPNEHVLNTFEPQKLELNCDQLV